MQVTSSCLAAVAFAGCCFAQTAASAAPAELEVPPADAVLRTLKPTHPRLLLTAELLEDLRQRVKEDAVLQRWHADLREEARKIQKEGPSKYEIPDGKRLLNTSRRVLSRVTTLALLARLDDDDACVARAWQELAAAAAFKDWNPSHFLDTAEMATAFALGYDWLYDRWSEEQRGVLRQAIIEKGLVPGLNSYRGEQRYGWWVKAHHNWNQVCNGGMVLGALAVAEDWPAESAEIVSAALDSLKRAMAEFGPDGAWPEGPSYWAYATSYNVKLLAALETALGTDFGFSAYPGFSETGEFPIHVTGPFGRSFNFADAGDGAPRAPQLFWLARTFDKPLYTWYQQHMARPAALDLVWFPGEVPAAAVDDCPLDRYFRRAEVVAFRSAWGDKDALFVGFKAGSNRVNHSNLDLGTFVLDALGERWFCDLGADNYNLPGYFGNQRWTYYRMRAEGHNTLVIAPDKEPDQDPAASTRIVAFESKPARAFAVADLTPAYKRQGARVRRGLALLDRRTVLLQDEVELGAPSDVWSFLHTRADVTLEADGRRAILRSNGKSLTAELLEPQGLAFAVLDAAPLPSSPNPPKQKQNEGTRKLAVQAPGVRTVRIVVLLTPAGAAEGAAAPEITPLAEW